MRLRLYARSLVCSLMEMFANFLSFDFRCFSSTKEQWKWSQNMKIPLYLIRWSLVVSLEKLALFLAAQGLPLSGTKTFCSLTSSTLITEVFCVVNSLRAGFPIYYYNVVQNSAAFLKISVPTKKVKIFNPFMTQAVIIQKPVH